MFVFWKYIYVLSEIYWLSEMGTVRAQERGIFILETKLLGSVTHSATFDFCDICLQIQLFRITQCLDFFAGAGNTESFKERGGNHLCDMVAGFCRYFCRVIFVDACFACMFLHVKYFQLYFIRLLSCKK